MVIEPIYLVARHTLEVAVSPNLQYTSNFCSCSRPHFASNKVPQHAARRHSGNRPMLAFRAVSGRSVNVPMKRITRTLSHKKNPTASSRASPLSLSLIIRHHCTSPARRPAINRKALQLPRAPPQATTNLQTRPNNRRAFSHSSPNLKTLSEAVSPSSHLNMEWTAVKVRETFIEYFKKNGHTFGEFC